MKGKISRYLSFKGFGFIEVDNQEKDVFFHVSNYPPNRLPVQGQVIEFELNITPKGMNATNIKIIEEEKHSDTSSKKEDFKIISLSSDLNKLTGIGSKYLQLMEASMVKSCEDLSSYTPEVLLTNLLSINNEENITKRPPTLTKVKDWINQASELNQ